MRQMLYNVEIPKSYLIFKLFGYLLSQIVVIVIALGIFFVIPSN